MTPCIQWWGTLNHDGYGVLKRRGKMIRAHRMVYEECYGVIPEGLLVRHRCDNPPCVNPEHLILGTRQDNVDDMMQRGRGVFPGAPRKTHCPKGHERVQGKPCRPCLNEAQRRYRARQKAK